MWERRGEPGSTARRGDDDCILPAVFKGLQEAPSANHERCPYDKNRREQQKSIPGHRRLPPASSRLITLHFLPFIKARAIRVLQGSRKWKDRLIKENEGKVTRQGRSCLTDGGAREDRSPVGPLNQPDALYLSIGLLSLGRAMTEWPVRFWRSLIRNPSFFLNWFHLLGRKYVAIHSSYWIFKGGRKSFRVVRVVSRSLLQLKKSKKK
jgi:hypothetical protein